MTDDVRVGSRDDTAPSILVADHDEPSRRAEVGDTRARAYDDADARDAAALVCRTARRLPGVEFVTVLAVDGNERVAPLASTTDTGGPDVGAALSARQARALIDRSGAGTWVARAADVVPGTGSRAPGTPVCAAVRDGDALVAILVLGGRDLRDAGDDTGRLTLATELAAVASGYLAPALAADARARERADLLRVIDHRAFQVVFQPVVELAGRGRVGIEASIRYDDGVAESDRVEHARRHGLCGELQVAVLERVVAASVNVPSECWLSVEVSPAQLTSNADVRALLAAMDRPLVVELTERERVDDYDPVRAALRTLGRGIEVAVDHVGSGYASLRHVLALQPTYVKLDETWVRDLDQDAARQALIAGLGYFATYTGCRLVGTGVRSEHEAEALAGLGVTLAQGPLFGTPRAPRRRTARR